MHEYMVIVNFLTAFRDEFASLIPDQQVEVKRLMEDGFLTSYCLSSDRETLWMTISADSSSAVDAIMKKMPLYKYMRYEIKGLMFHIKSAFTPMQFSMN